MNGMNGMNGREGMECMHACMHEGRKEGMTD